MRAILALEDGRYFEGESFGATEPAAGEMVFNTSMTGYQEVLTDPSYRGQFVAMTYPLIGNYGINTLDAESAAPHVRGFVIGELSAVASNWRSQSTLGDYLSHWKIPGIQGVDTRALTKHLREKGAMKAYLTTERIPPAEAVKRAVGGSGMVGMDYVQEVTTRKTYDWDPQDKLSRNWTIVKGDMSTVEIDKNGDVFEKLPPVKHHIVAFDFGIKHNILRNLRQQGFKVRVVPAKTSASDVLAMKPDGVFLSNGPGDPAALGYTHKTVRQLVESETPVFGICLGHQILGYAYGGKTYKLKFGHHGGNQPVKDLATGKVAITAQNHGFAVDPDSLPSNVEVTHINLNDDTVEGMRHRDLPVFSVQYHPEAAPGPHDANYFFGDFAKLIEATKNS